MGLGLDFETLGLSDFGILGTSDFGTLGLPRLWDFQTFYPFFIVFYFVKCIYISHLFLMEV